MLSVCSPAVTVAFVGASWLLGTIASSDISVVCVSSAAGDEAVVSRACDFNLRRSADVFKFELVN